MAFGLPVQSLQTELSGVPTYRMPPHLNYGHVAGACAKIKKKIFLPAPKYIWRRPCVRQYDAHSLRWVGFFGGFVFLQHPIET